MYVVSTTLEPAKGMAGLRTTRVLFASMSLVTQILVVSIISVSLSVLVTRFLFVVLPPTSTSFFHISLAISIVAPLLVAPPSTWLIGALLLRAEACRQLAELLATTDSLTGALNRRRFFALAAAMIAPHTAAKSPVAALLLDIDHFKSINDQYGHAVGDIVLKRVAERCKDRLLPDDLFARLGGEEFVILLPDVSGVEAVRAAERIRLGVEALSILIADGQIVRATVSIGVGVLEDHSATVDVLLDAADKAMYVAKRQGRNRVYCGSLAVRGVPAHQPADRGSPFRRASSVRQRDSSPQCERTAVDQARYHSRTLQWFGDVAIRVGRSRVTLYITGISVLISVSIGLLTMVAWDAPFGEDRLLLSLCVIVPLIVATPIGWTAATVALEAHAAQGLAERQATTDPLTELSNRRHFFKVAYREFASAVQLHRPLVVFILDLDHFKSINDTYGHATGDAVLTRVAQVAQACLRPHDILARMGGEEFVALLPDTSLTAALPMAEAIRAAVAAISMSERCAEAIHPTLSIGVAALRSVDESITQLLERADKAMYAAKHAGRNQVHVTGDGVTHG